MAAVDLEVLGKPLSPTDPCGADLELSGDIEYMNFVAGAEGLLPKSYFGRDANGNEGRPFDRSQIPFDAQLEAAAKFFDKTRDLRLIGIIAKLSILNRDLAGFSACIRALTTLLETQWDNVHPRGEDGDFGLRAVAVESLEVMPTIVLPLQFLPLLQHNRLGSLTYRGVLIARGEVIPTVGEEKTDPVTVEKILSEAELDALRSVRQQVADLNTAVKQIQTIWVEKCSSGPTINIERFAGTVEQIFTTLDAALEKRSPSAPAEPAAEATSDGQPADPAKPVAAAAANARIASTGHAARALDAAAKYFSQHEPSNPALMIVRQAQALLGKSFLEVLKVLIPEQVSKATVNIGKDQYFAMPVERLAAASGNAGAAANAPQTDGQLDVAIEIHTRIEALALLEQVGNYFRVAEPSSPIPFLTERARDLAQRDFLSVLTTMLPANTLKNS